MNSSVERTLLSSDAWTIARDRLVEDLSEEERQVYRDASLETIFHDASAAEKLHKASSASRKYIERLQPLVQAIDQYGLAIDVYANTYSLVMSPLWGSVRIVLHVRSPLSLWRNQGSFTMLSY